MFFCYLDLGFFLLHEVSASGIGEQHLAKIALQKPNLILIKLGFCKAIMLI